MNQGIESNKAFRLLVGAFVIFLAYKLYSTNWFGQFLEDESEGFSDPAIVTMLLSCVVSAVELCGILAIGLVTNILTPLLEPLYDYVAGLAGRLNINLPKSPRTPQPTVDAAKLIETLQSITDRLDALDGKGESDD